MLVDLLSIHTAVMSAMLDRVEFRFQFSVYMVGEGQLVSAQCSWSVDRATALRACVAGHHWDLERESE